MIDKGLLISGNSIPFPGGKIMVGQPKLKSLLALGEKNYLQAISLLTFSKEILSDKDKILLKDINDFDVLMSIINDDSKQEAYNSKDIILDILTVLFPEHEIILDKGFIILKKEKEIPSSINSENFADFREILKEIFCLNKSKEQNYNPSGPKAKSLAERFKKKKQMLSEQKNKKDESLFENYLSILEIGLGIDINSLLDYTVYQIYDAFDRFNLKEAYDISLQAKMAGAKSDSLDKVEHWMKNIHS